jgi:5-methylcytosine-specific restriction endonuclease McrA
MISSEDLRKRSTELHGYMRSRFGPKKYTAGKRKGQLKTLGRALPFTRDELHLWILRTVGMQAMPCPWCQLPIDALSMVLDHEQPIERGGDLSLDNLSPICSRCNQLKGTLTVLEYAAIALLLRRPTMAFARTNIESRLLAGEQGKRLARVFRAEKAKARQVPAQTVIDDF